MLEHEAPVDQLKSSTCKARYRLWRCPPTGGMTLREFAHWARPRVVTSVAKMKMSSYLPLREILNNEIHGRAGHPIEPPAEVLHLAFTLSSGDADPLLSIETLCVDSNSAKPNAGALHHAVTLQGGLLRFERHGEFYRISLSCGGASKLHDPVHLVPNQWLDSLPGQRLVAILPSKPLSLG